MSEYTLIKFNIIITISNSTTSFFVAFSLLACSRCIIYIIKGDSIILTITETIWIVTDCHPPAHGLHPRIPLG